MNEWNIQSRAHACQVCAGPFSDQDICHTLLFDNKEEFTRMDICGDCWGAQYKEGVDRKGFISHWQGTYEAPKAVPDPIHKETAETLLRKLVEVNDPKHAATCYILAVMLERKRVLKIREQLRRDSQRVFIYEHPPSGDLFSIVDPNLQLTQLDGVQRDVAALLEHGLTAPALATEDGISGQSVTSPDLVEQGDGTAEAQAAPPGFERSGARTTEGSGSITV